MPYGLIQVAVGSRVTCIPAPTDTDDDQLVYTLNIRDLEDELMRDGFEHDGSRVNEGSNTSPFRSYSKGDVNLIVTDKLTFFKAFITATHIAKKLNILNKHDRIILFQGVLYGNCHQ